MEPERGPGLLQATAAYDYELPSDLIAARPADRRDTSRLLHVDRESGALSDRVFGDLADLVPAGDALVINDSRVFRARLTGRKPTGARAEVLLIRPAAEPPAAASPERTGSPADPDPLHAFERPDPRLWEAIVRPGGKLKPGRRVDVAPGFQVEIVDSRPDGTRLVRLHGEGDAWALIGRHGHVPLPPYIEREDDAADAERYQTVYARPVGSVAAPTAGLHFTAGLLAAIEERGAKVVRVTLHVGVGTFRPVSVERLDEHELHAEGYRLMPEAAGTLNGVRAAGGRVWSVGTTTCRVLETCATEDGSFRPGRGWTDLFIRPPHRFRGVDVLLTNFHLPRSSLLVLVTAFGGHELVRRAYRHAVERRYRFYSYGDAMLVT